MKTAVRIVGSAALVGLLAWRLDWGQLRQAFAALDLRLWALALAVYLAAQVVSSLRWQLLAAPLGFDLSFGRYVALYFVGTFFNLVLPTSVGGDVVRVWYLAADKRQRGRAFLSVLAERGSGVGVLVLLACVGACFVPVELPPWMVTLLVALGAGFVCGVACVPALPLCTRLPLVGERLVPFADLVRTYLRRPELILIATALSVVVQLASVAQMWLVAVGLGLDVSFGYLTVAVPLLTLLTLVPVSVNGMGLREVGLVVLLTPVGVTAAQAVSLSVLQFAVCVAASLVGGGFYLAGPYARYAPSPEGQSDDESVGGDPDQGREGQPAQAA